MDDLICMKRVQKQSGIFSCGPGVVSGFASKGSRQGKDRADINE